MEIISSIEARIKHLNNIYFTCKSLILYSEEIDPNTNSNIQVIKELRDALDHLMIFFRDLLANNDVEEEKKHIACIEKAIGHVYRAGFDALDGTALSLKEPVWQILTNYDLNIIISIIPNYADIKNDIMDISENIAKLREEKSNDELGKVFDSYLQSIEKLRKHHKTITNSIPFLNKAQSIARNKKIKDWWLTWGISITIATIGILIAIILSK